MKCLFDTHCHLYDERYDEFKDELIKEIEASDIKYLVDIGTDIYTCKKVVEDTKKYSFCYGTVGYYPGDTGKLTDEILSEVFDMYKDNEKIVAIGEIGLDTHDPENYPELDVQKKWLRAQLSMARELNAPICIHSRDADNETFQILKEEVLGKTPVLLHCFSGSKELAAEYVKLGAMISLGGPVTFKNARHSQEVATSVPLEKLLIETDAPYLTPVPFRGEINKPNYVEHTARKIAELRDISYEELANATLENACRFYRIKNEK